MRRFITILFLTALTAVNVSAQGIFQKSHGQKATSSAYQGTSTDYITFRANQSKFHLYLYHDDGKTAIVVRIRSERLVFNPEPVLKLTAADGSDLQYALFPIDEEQLHFFENQISAVSINTIPSISGGKVGADSASAFQKALLDGAK